MVYIRNKKVKGIDYAYLVKSVWDHNINASRQKTIKYLGKASNITIEDIPEVYRKDPKIISFVAFSGSKDRSKKQALLFQLKEELFRSLSNGDIGNTLSIYERYIRFYDLVDFYDNLLKPLMYEIGKLWSENRLDIATEHICSNTAQSLIDIINSQNLKKYRHNVKVLICTPSGELHSLACKVIESILISKGFKVYNISPSVQADSIIRYIKDREPDSIFISITLDENIKAGRTLIKKIRTASFSIPILLGGIAISQREKLELDATICKDGLTNEILRELKSIKT